MYCLKGKEVICMLNRYFSRLSNYQNFLPVLKRQLNKWHFIYAESKAKPATFKSKCLCNMWIPVPNELGGCTLWGARWAAAAPRGQARPGLLCPCAGAAGLEKWLQNHLLPPDPALGVLKMPCVSLFSRPTLQYQVLLPNRRSNRVYSVGR